MAAVTTRQCWADFQSPRMKVKLNELSRPGVQFAKVMVGGSGCCRQAMRAA